MASKLNDMVAQTSGALPDRVAAMSPVSQMNADLVDQLMKMQKGQNDLELQRQKILNAGPVVAPGTGTKQALTGLPGILALLGAGGAAAFGGAQGGEAATGILAGLGQAGQDINANQANAANQQNLMRKEQLSSIEDQQKQTQDILAANQTRLASMIQANPTLFVDPTTGESVIDPRLIGYTATGFLIPIDPGANYALKKNAELKDNQYKTGLDLLLKGETEERRQVGAQIINNTLGLNLPVDQVAKMPELTDEELSKSLLSNPNLDPLSVYRAINYARTNNLPMSDTSVATMVQAKTDKVASLQGKVAGLLATFTARLGQGSPDLMNAPLETQLGFAFPDDAGAQVLLKKELMGTSAFQTGLSSKELVSMIASQAAPMLHIWDYSPDAVKAMDPTIQSVDDIYNFAVKNIGTALDNFGEADVHASATQVGLDIATLANVYQSAGADPREANILAGKDVMDLKKKHTTGTNRLNMEEYKSDFLSLLKSAREQSKAGK